MNVLDQRKQKLIEKLKKSCVVETWKALKSVLCELATELISMHKSTEQYLFAGRNSRVLVTTS